MFISNYNRVRDRGTATKTMTSDTAIAPFDELLAHSIRLRDLYKNARCQISDPQCRPLRLLFDDHYREQLRLVDVLIDRVRALGGASRIFADDFLQSPHLTHALRGRQAQNRLLREMLEAHEWVLSAARPDGTSDVYGEGSWVRDFAVGQVVLSNDLQSRSIGELLSGRGSNPGMPTPLALMSD